MSAPVQESADARLLAIDDAALRLIDLALDEDIGAGDWTTRWTVPPRARMEARLVAPLSTVLRSLMSSMARRIIGWPVSRSIRQALRIMNFRLMSGKLHSTSKSSACVSPE